MRPGTGRIFVQRRSAAPVMGVRCACAVSSLSKNWYLVLSIILVSASIAMVLNNSFSYYEFKYGRDLLFTGVSKHLLSFAIFCLAIGFYSLHRSRNRHYEQLVESDFHLVPFIIASIAFISAYVFEADLV